MKIWLTDGGDDEVVVHMRKPQWADRLFEWTSGRCTWICRRSIKRLLRGTGKRLPRVGSEECVDVELTAK